MTGAGIGAAWVMTFRYSGVRAAKYGFCAG